MYESLVKEYFSFLSDYGYNIDKEKWDNSISSISYEGCENRIKIWFSKGSYEIGYEFEDFRGNTFSLSDALEYTLLTKYKGVYQIADKECIEKGIIYIANVVQLFLETYNVSNQIYFDQIYQYKIYMADTLLEKYYIENDLKKAEAYWKKKEYDKAKELFEKYLDNLSKTQLKKLEYIKKVEKCTAP